MDGGSIPDSLFYGPGVNSASNRNEYHESSWGWGVKHGQGIRLTTTPPSQNRFSRKGGSLEVSQPYGLPRPVIGVALVLLQKAKKSHFSRTKGSLATSRNKFSWRFQEMLVMTKKKIGV
jgi:hypothetical protein